VPDPAAYVELQVTTNYSFLRGASHVEELFAAAQALGLALSTCWTDVAKGRDQDGVLAATPQRQRR